MSDAIYTVGIGPAFRHRVVQLIESIRRHGCTLPVIAIVDGAITADCETIVVCQDELTTWEMTGRNATYLRTLPGRLRAIVDRYDRLLYIDADCEATGRVDALLAQDRDKICVQKYPRPLIAVAMNFTDADRSRIKGHPFALCAGIVAYPGREWGREFLLLWHFECQARRFDDQTALNLVVHRQYPEAHTVLHHVCFASNEHPSCLVIHRLGDGAAPITTLSDIPLAGDVVAAIAKRVGADRLAAWWTKMTGKDCGCADRREWLNRATEKLVRWARGPRGGEAPTGSKSA